MGVWDLTVTCGGERYSLDAEHASLVPGDLRLGTSSQGGPTTLECGLLRTLGIGSERIYDPVRVWGSGQVIWEGRLHRASRTVTRQTARMSPSAAGLGALLEDRQDIRFLGIDRELGNWRTAPAKRTNVILTTPWKPVGSATGTDGGLLLRLEGYAWTSNAGRPVVEGYYSAAPLRAARVVAQFVKRAGAAGSVAWNGAIQAVDPATGNGGATSTNYGATAGDSQAVNFTISGGATDLSALLYHTATAGGSANDTIDHLWQNLAVIGDHGLPLTGSSAADYGLKASDVLAHLLRRFVPGVTPGYIADSGLGIQQVNFTDPTSVGQILGALNAYHAWAWGVWEGGRLDFHPYGDGRSRTWYVKAQDPGVTLNQEGDDGTALWSDIVVTYSDANGYPHSVGGPGTIAEAFDSRLSITDASHPAVGAGVRRVYVFEMGVPSIQATAAQVGQVLLAQLNAARRSGTVDLTGMVTDEAGTEFPAYLVRGGDQIVVTDVGDPTPRRVVDALYTHATKTVSCTVDNQLQTVEAIVAHLGGRSVGRA